MTTSYTLSSTFTITDARRVASKLGADLRNLQSKYGEPSTSEIETYVEETALYLKAGYLSFVQYGFRDGDRWVLKLEYTAVAGGQLRDDVPGSLPSEMAVVGYTFHSYLEWNRTFINLTPEQKAAFKSTLPTSRTPGTAPTANRGVSGTSAQYSSNERGLDRSVYLDI